MTKQLFTPGPWSYSAAVDQPDGFWIGNEGENAAYVPGFTDHPGNIANARLISAAPDMLEALSELDALIDFSETDIPAVKTWTFDNTGSLVAAMKKAAAAISKAHGCD